MRGAERQRAREGKAPHPSLKMSAGPSDRTPPPRTRAVRTRHAPLFDAAWRAMRRQGRATWAAAGSESPDRLEDAGPCRRRYQVAPVPVICRDVPVCVCVKSAHVGGIKSTPGVDVYKVNSAEGSPHSSGRAQARKAHADPAAAATAAENSGGTRWRSARASFRQFILCPALSPLPWASRRPIAAHRIKGPQRESPSCTADCSWGAGIGKNSTCRHRAKRTKSPAARSHTPRGR